MLELMGSKIPAGEFRSSKGELQDTNLLFFVFNHGVFTLSAIVFIFTLFYTENQQIRYFSPVFIGQMRLGTTAENQVLHHNQQKAY